MKTTTKKDNYNKDNYNKSNHNNGNHIRDCNTFCIFLFWAFFFYICCVFVLLPAHFVRLSYLPYRSQSKCSQWFGLILGFCKTVQKWAKLWISMLTRVHRSEIIQNFFYFRFFFLDFCFKKRYFIYIKKNIGEKGLSIVLGLIKKQNKKQFTARRTVESANRYFSGNFADSTAFSIFYN